jgi:metal-sulfur cluster biosynthetic enzyme
MPEVNEIRELESEAVEAASVPTGADPTDADPTGAGQGNGSAKDADSLKEQILEALKNVLDPELGVNIVDLGLVYGVEIEGDAVHVTYTLTTMGCPIGPLIEAEIRQFLSTVEGVEQVEAEMVLRPPWTPEMMSEEAKAALGFF